MTKALIITYYWPPSGGSGVQRWLKFAKYLPEFGVTPLIYTPENPHFNITDDTLLKEIHPDLEVIKTPIWEPYKIASLLSGKKNVNHGLIDNKKKSTPISSLLNRIRANFFIPDPRIFWVKPSIKYLTKYLKENKVDCIITTGPPHSMHLIGLGVKKAFPNIKWIVDIRDPWSSFDFLRSFGSTQKSIDKQADLETLVLKNCDQVLSTSYSMKNLLQQFDHNKFKVITNGYDQEDFRNFKDLSNPEKIRIYHAGLMNQLRNPKKLWEILNQICKDNSEIDSKLEIHLVGIVDPEVIKTIQNYSRLKSKLIIEGYKNHKDLILDYAKADILLLLVNNSDNASANIPGKLFEYFATNKPILAFTSKTSDAANLLKPLGSLIYDYNENINIEKSKIISYLLESKDVSNRPSPGIQQKFERKNLTESLAGLLYSK